MNTNLKQGKLEILDKSLKRGFAQVPRIILKADNLSRNAKCLYALLLDYAWQKDSCFPGQDKLANDLCVSMRTIRRDLIELKQFGLIDWHQRGKNKTNIYYLLPIDFLDKSDRTDMSAPGGTDLTAQDGTNMSDLIEEENNTQFKNTQTFSFEEHNGNLNNVKELENDKKTTLYFDLEKNTDFESFDIEAKELAIQLNDKKNIFYYQSIIRKRNKGEITDSQIQSALWFVKEKLAIDKTDGKSFWKNPGAMFTNKLKEILAKNRYTNTIEDLAKSKIISKAKPKDLNLLRNNALKKLQNLESFKQ